MTYAIDADLQTGLAQLPQLDLNDLPCCRAGTLEMAAQMNAAIAVDGLAIDDQWVPGAEPVRVRLYRPVNGDGPLPAILYIHGGGFVIGSIETEHSVAVGLARALGVVVVSVDYRLAPEHPYPAPLEDCYSALVWLAENSVKLNVDSTRIAVMGQSAGGGLSAGLALLSRDRGGPAICFQFLGVPEVDDRLETVSMRAFTDTPLWNLPSAELSWNHYLGGECPRGDANVPIYAAPARATAEQLKGLPPAYVTAMEFDPLRDENIQYALAMMQAGVRVELHCYPGTFHGSGLIADALSSQVQVRDTIDVLRRALHL